MTTPTRPTYLDRILAQGIDIETAIETAINGAITFLPYRIERALYSGKYLDTTSDVSNPNSFFLNPDETKMFMIGGNVDSVAQFTLTTPGDPESAELDGTFDVSGQDINPEGITFNSTGTRMYMVGSTSDAVHQYNLGTAWEIVASPPTYAGNQSVAGQTTAPLALLMSPDDSTLLVTTSNAAFQYTLSTPSEIIGGSMSYASLTAALTIRGMAWAPAHDGTPGGFLVYVSSLTIVRRKLNTPYSLSGAAADPTPAFSVVQQSGLRDVKFVGGGSRMWTCGTSPDGIHEYYTSAAVPTT